MLGPPHHDVEPVALCGEYGATGCRLPSEAGARIASSPGAVVMVLVGVIKRLISKPAS
jgi:hypothetical protein